VGHREYGNDPPAEAAHDDKGHHQQDDHDNADREDELRRLR